MADFVAWLKSGVLSGMVAFAVTVALLPVILQLSRRWGLYDGQGPLKIHTRRIPRLGGIAIAGGIFAGAASYLRPQLEYAFAPIIVLAGIWITGLVDDLRGLSAVVRLLAQLGAGCALWAAGWTVPFFANPWLNLAATCFVVVAFINAFNFLDGADGVAASVALVIGLAYVLLPAADISHSGRCLAIALAGSCAGFLIFNFPPARIFMGDSGSTVLGLCIAFLGLDFWSKESAGGAGLTVPFLLAALPLLDLGMAVVRRWRKHVPVSSGDRQHCYDLLLQRGWPARRVVFTCAFATALLAAAAWLGIHQPLPVALLGMTACLMPLAATLVYLGALRA